jgi:CheY-like chemotaxis protein
LLVLATPDGIAAQLLPLLQKDREVQVVATPDQAAAALRSGDCDLFLSDTAELVPLVTEESPVGSALESISQGACVVDRDGHITWANAVMRAYSQEFADKIRHAVEAFLKENGGAAQPGATRFLRQAFDTDDERHFDLSISTLTTPETERAHALALITETTDAVRLRERLDAIDAAGRELVALDVAKAAKMDVTERLTLLEESLIRYCRDLLNFTHFAVLVVDPKTRHLDTVLAGKLPPEVMDIDIYAEEEGNGISGYVAATGRSYICPDITHDPLYLPGLDMASSSLTVPLWLLGEVVGVLNVESDELDAFTDEDRQVAEIFGRYIAVALHTLKLLAVERSETTGQVTSELMSELMPPLDGIVAEASRLMEDLKDEAARPRLGGIIQHVDQVKRSLQAQSSVPAVRGLIPEKPDADPALKGKRVLVADDEDIIRETIGDVLSKAGALAVTARDGDEAIAMIRSQRFDLVLSDIKMPNKNGYEVFAAAKESSPGCPVILVTGFGYDPDHALVRASREGLEAILFKPFKVEQLLEAIHKAVTKDAV